MVTTTIDGNEKVLATAQKIVESFGNSMNIKHDMIRILSTFDKRFSHFGVFYGTVEEKFESAENTILHWESKLGTSLLWDYSIDETKEYVSAIDEILKLIDDNEDCDVFQNQEMMNRVDRILQKGMLRLENEFHNILERNEVLLDGEKLNGLIQRNSVSIPVCLGSFNGGSEDFERYAVARESLAAEEEYENVCVELVNSDAVIDLNEIGQRMMKAGYEKECCQAYINVRRTVVSEWLSILGVDKMGFEKLQRIEWGALDEKIKRWVYTIKIVVKVLLFAEKQLCERVFGGSEQITSVYFVEIARGCVWQLLNFAEGIVIGQRSSEKLFRILDMYDALNDVTFDLKALFANGPGEFLCREAQNILIGLGAAANGTFFEFEKAVQGETSRRPTQGGEVHPLARYVMNYIKLFVDYSKSLNFILQGKTDDSFCQDSDAGVVVSPMRYRFQSLIAILESNLEEKSKFYEDGAIRYIFLMNNLLYIVQKVKDSHLGYILGDTWVRKHRSKVRQYATGYLRASWSKALSSLKDEGVGGSGKWSSVSKVALKQRFKNFNAAFEEIYKNQTSWKVTDPQLRDELRISISEKVIPAYRSFLGRFRGHLETKRNSGKYIKYTPEDLENHLSSLFEGTAKVLHNPWRKQST